jgi:hypothetical protein
VAAAGPEAGLESGAPAPDAAVAPEAGVMPKCVTGQVKPNEVVMLGDSYLDPFWGNVGPTIMSTAGAMYRHYYIGGASMGWGDPNTQFFIPYQFQMALMDTSVMNPMDIKVVILDGGGNDVLIGNGSCETTPPPANASCVTTVQNAINEAKSKINQWAQSIGIKYAVYFFYPHLDPNGGGLLPSPAPGINPTLDYAYPLAEQLCCGHTFTSDLTNYSCSGEPVPGSTCVFIDTRPAFEGHLADYIKGDHIHPTQAGAQVIADLIWKQMQAHCIAQ